MDCQMKLFVGKSDSRIEIDTVPQLMATASPVFDRMLQPDRFLEGQKLLAKEPFTVSLAEDDPSAVKVICDILHYRAGSVAVKEMTLTLLASIATVVDKYDFALTIQPWPKLWLIHLLSSQPSHNFETMTAQELTMWTHISCHLGYENQFRECTSSLIRKLPPCGPRGNQPIRGYKLLSGTVRDALQNSRDKCIRSFRNVCFYTIKEIQTDNQCRSLYKPTGWSDEDHQQSRMHCNALILGSATLAAQKLCNGQNWEKSDNWRESPTYHFSAMLKFAERLNSVRDVEHVEDAPEGRVQVHKNCGLGELTKIQVEIIYERTKAGLNLSEVGSHAYRK